MKKNILLACLLLVTIVSINAQSSLDSLKLVLPVGHTQGVSSAVYSTDGLQVLTNSFLDNTERIYDVATGKELKVFTKDQNCFNCTIISPDAKKVLITSGVDCPKIHEILTGNEIILKDLCGARLESSLFSPDSKYLLTVCDGNAKVFDVLTGEVLIVREDVNTVVFSNNSKYTFLHGFGDTSRIVDINTGIDLALIINGQDINLPVFSPSDKLLVTIHDDIPDNTDYSARIYDVSTGKLLHVLTGHKDKVNSAVFSHNSKSVITASNDGTARIFDVVTGREIQMLTSGDSYEVNYAFFSPDDMTAMTIKTGFDGIIRIYKLSTRKMIKEFYGGASGINFAIFSKDGKQILTAGETAKIYNTMSGKVIKEFKGNSVKINSIDLSYNANQVLITGDKNARILDIKTGNQTNMLSGNTEDVYSAFFNNFAQKAITLSYDGIARLYDVFTGKILKEFNSTAAAIFSPDGKFILNVVANPLERKDNCIKLFDVMTGIELYDFTDKKTITTSANFSPDGKYLLTISNGDKAIIYDFLTGQKIKVLKEKKSSFQHVVFSPDSKKLLTTSYNHNRIKVYDIQSKKIISSFDGDEHPFPLMSIVFSPNGNHILASSMVGNTLIYEVSSGKIQNEFLRDDYLNNTAAIYSPDGKLVLSMRIDGLLQIYDVASSKELKVLKGHSNKLISAEFTPDGKKLLTASMDNKIILWDVESGNLIYETILLTNKNWLVKLPNSPYYMCSKEASKMLHYVTPSLKVIGFEQLDPVYNRPDIVLDSIAKYFGGGDLQLIANYREIWEKRIDRLGLDKEKLRKGDISVPIAEIVDADKIAYELKDDKLEIKVSASDPKYKLQRFNILVNEVPLFGSQGISIKQLNSQNWDSTFSIPLSLGENKIQVSVMNELGLENFKYPTYVNYKSIKVVPKTYFIGIAVDNFNNGKNLSFCVKDVEDLSNYFSKLPNTQIKLLTEKEVNKENITQLKEYLQKTSVHDRVIISCNSHGLLDSTRNFYLATHDTDFDSPNLNGISYEMLDGLLDDIPARKKLLLLDACNSGENDEGYSKIDNSPSKARGVNVVIGDEIVKETNFKKMKELFVNVRNNSGAYIISATGGIQKALEGEAVMLDGKPLENGSFTFAVLEYLKANTNNSTMLTVNQLKNYVENRVVEITNGRQTPTSRQETMEIDWDLH